MSQNGKNSGAGVDYALKEGGYPQNLLRLFVAIDLPEIVKEEIARIQVALMNLNMFSGSYVKPEIAHVTLKFLGYVEIVAIPHIKKALQTVIFSPMDVCLGSLGDFGNEQSVKIIWLNLVSDGIIDLAKRVDECLPTGAGHLNKAFHVHVTLARVKECQNPMNLRSALRNVDVRPIRFTVGSFSLKQSFLTPGGPLHIEVASYGVNVN